MATSIRGTPVAVEHAVATRMRPERDLIVVPGVQSDRAEPLEKDGVVGKLGIDATTLRRRSPRLDTGPPARRGAGEGS